MKLLLIAAAMFGSAYGACITATPEQLAAAFVTGGTAATGSGTDIIADAGTATCLAGYFGTATAACSTAASAAGTVATWSGCTVCETVANAATGLTCTSITGTTTATVTFTCTDGFYQTNAGEVAVGSTTPAVAATTGTCPSTCATTYGATCVPSDATITKAQVVAVPATTSRIAPACTACTGKAGGDGCATAGTVCSTVLTTLLTCIKANNNYKLVSGVAVACAGVGAKTWKAQATAGTDATCEIASCTDNYNFVTSDKSCAENTCTALTAQAANYVAAGIPKVDAVVAVSANCGLAAGTGIYASGYGYKAQAAEVPATAYTVATKPAGLGAITCGAGYTAGTGANAPAASCTTAAVTDPVTANTFTFSGCTVTKASPASAAQTMIACVLAVVAMYL